MEDTVPDDAEHLKSLRLAAGLDLAQLAALSNLSAGQVRQLEEGGESLFYSPQIKAQSMRRVIRLLASPPDNSSGSDQPNTSAGARPAANVIDDIIRLSEKSLNSTVVHSELRRRRGVAPKLLAVALLVITALALAVWQSNQHKTQAMYSEWVSPLSSQVLTAAEAVAPISPTLAPVPSPPPSRPEPAQAVTPPVALSPVSQASQVPGHCADIQFEPFKPTPTGAQPTKPSTYVYMLASKPIQLCVDDAKRKQTVLSLSAGQGRTVHGQAPWTIAAHDLQSVQIYFQGSKVWLPADASQRIVLTAQAVDP